MADKSSHLIATFTVKEGKLEQFLEAVKKVTSTVHDTEPGVLRYFAFQTKNSQGQDQVVFVEKYANAEAKKAHASTAHFKTFVGQVQGFLAVPLEIKEGPLVAGYENKANL